MRQTLTSSDLSIQWQDVDATSTLYDVAVAFGIDDIQPGPAVSAIAEQYAMSAVQSLDVSSIQVGANQTLASLGEVDGKISAEAVKIQIDQSQVNFLTSDLAIVSAALSSKQDILIGTTQSWQTHPSFKPPRGQIVIWSDKSVMLSTWEDDTGHIQSADVVIPGVKIGNGNAYNLDLPFIGDEIALLLSAHIQSNMHVTPQERDKWNHKITVGSVEDPTDDGVIDETLIITRC